MAKKKDDSARYSSPGIGNGQHLVAELMAQKTGIKMMRVTYKGSNRSLQAVLGGDVNLSFQTATSVIGHIKAGRLKALGFTGPSRVPVLPDVPTVAEAGIPGFLYEVAWHAWFVPAKTPSAIVERLHAEIRKAVFQPKLGEFFSSAAMNRRRIRRQSLSRSSAPISSGSRKWCGSRTSNRNDRVTRTT